MVFGSVTTQNRSWGMWHELLSQLRGLDEALDGFLVLSQRLGHATFPLWLLTSFYLLSALGLHPLSLSLLYPLLCLLLPLHFICPTSSLELFRHFVANIYWPHHCYFFTPDISLLLAQPTLLMKKLKCRQEKTVQEKPVNRPNVKTMRDGIRGCLPADSENELSSLIIKPGKKM